jgi:hypothetical protein
VEEKGRAKIDGHHQDGITMDFDDHRLLSCSSACAGSFLVTVGGAETGSSGRALVSISGLEGSSSMIAADLTLRTRLGRLVGRGGGSFG